MDTFKLALAGFLLLLCCASAQAAAPPADVTPTQGLNCVFFADGPLVTINSRLAAMTKKAGIAGHSHLALTYDADPKKRKAKILEALSGSKVDLLGLGYSKKSMGNTLAPYIDVMDAALATNPRMQFMILSPSPLNIPIREVARLKGNGDRFHTSIFRALVKPLRIRYPSNRILCAYYGRAASELKTQFVEKQVPGVPTLVGQKGVFLTKAGQPGPILDDLNAMFTGSLIYDINWAGVKLHSGYGVDLAAINKKVLKFEARHRPTTLEPFAGDRPNIFIKETWVPDWGYTVPVKPRKGYNCLFYGHGFFIPLVEAIQPIAEKGGVTGHNAVIFKNSPHDGAAGIGVQKLRIPKKGPDHGKTLRAALDTGKIDVLGLTYYEADTGRLEHYKEWIDYALAKNPKTRFLIHMPASYDAARRDLKILNKTGDAFRARFYATVIRPLRRAYPKQEIIFWYSGTVASELRRRFEAGKLSPVKSLIGPKGIFAVPAGIPGPLLRDLEGLILYSLIYKVDLPKTMTGQKGKLDLNALAEEMVAKEAAKGM